MWKKSLVEFVPENKKQIILDIGCGNGEITSQLADLSGKVIAIDNSEKIIEEAKQKFPNIDFRVCNALDISFENELDIVFSNAVFHWIHEQDTLLKKIHKALKPNGLLLCEFGGERNIETIESAFINVYTEMGHSYNPKFNLHTVEDFKKILQNNRFIVDEIYDYDRHMILEDREKGLDNWIKRFFASDLKVLSEDSQIILIEKVKKLTRDYLWNGKQWKIDYRRLRAITHIKK